MSCFLKNSKVNKVISLLVSLLFTINSVSFAATVPADTLRAKSTRLSSEAEIERGLRVAILDATLNYDETPESAAMPRLSLQQPVRTSSSGETVGNVKYIVNGETHDLTLHYTVTLRETSGFSVESSSAVVKKLLDAKTSTIAVEEAFKSLFMPVERNGKQVGYSGISTIQGIKDIKDSIYEALQIGVLPSPDVMYDVTVVLDAAANEQGKVKVGVTITSSAKREQPEDVIVDADEATRASSSGEDIQRFMGDLNFEDSEANMYAIKTLIRLALGSESDARAIVSGIIPELRIDKNSSALLRHLDVLQGIGERASGSTTAVINLLDDTQDFMVVSQCARTLGAIAPADIKVWDALMKAGEREVLADEARGVLDETLTSVLTAENLDKITHSAQDSSNDVLVNLLFQAQQTADLVKVSGEPAKPMINGVVAINERTIPENQRAVVVKNLSRNSAQLKELEKQLGCTIRLLSQLKADDIAGKQLIIISHEKIQGYENAKYLNVDNDRVNTELYMPVSPYIGIARLLLSASNDNVDKITDILNKGDLYRSLFGRPATEQDINKFLQTGIFELPVPRVNLDQAESKQRIALAALIAA